LRSPPRRNCGPSPLTSARSSTSPSPTPSSTTRSTAPPCSVPTRPATSAPLPPVLPGNPHRAGPHPDQRRRARPIPGPGRRGAGATHRIEIAEDPHPHPRQDRRSVIPHRPALPVAPADTIVRDFPLTTESFNLSYAGNDLWPARQVARARWEVASAAFAVTTHPGSRARR
jgi:hypothetical protein